jgi:multiple sugar transport system permease protein
MIPTQVSIVGLVSVCNITGLYGTFWPLILPAIATPTTVYYMKQYMENSLSIDIIESARIDGAKELYIFNKIVLPILKPAMATQAIIAFVSSWNNLYTPSILLATETSTKGTMPMFIEALKANDKERDFGQIYCALLITVLPILIAYLFLSKRIVEGVALGGVKE